MSRHKPKHSLSTRTSSATRPSSSQRNYYPTRFRLYNGEHLTLPCGKHESFSSIISKIADRKRIPKIMKSSLVVKLPQGEVFFDASQKYSEFLDACRMFGTFRDDKKKAIPEATLISKDDIGDKIQRREKIASPAGQVHWQGWLEKMSGKRTKQWKKRYFVLQDNTLLIYDDKDEYDHAGLAIEAIPMGSCAAVAWPPMSLKNVNKILKAIPKNKLPMSPPMSPRTTKKKGAKQEELRYVFELHATHIKFSRFYFMAKSEDELMHWVDSIFLVNFNRVKTICRDVITELTRRNSLEVEAIFRIEGAGEDILALKAKYDVADYPTLQDVEDEHVLTGLFKLILEKFESPLLTFKLFHDFITAMEPTEDSAKVAALKAVVKKLPPANVSFLEYLILFFIELSKEVETNKMSIANIAAVMAPVLLWPKNKDDLDLGVRGKCQKVIQFLIQDWSTIYGKRGFFRGKSKRSVDKLGYRSRGKSATSRSFDNSKHKGKDSLRSVPEKKTNEAVEDENVFYEGDTSDEESDDAASANPEVLSKIFEWQARQEEEMGGLREEAIEVDKAWDGIWDILLTADSIPDDVKTGVDDCLATQLQLASEAIAAMHKLTKTVKKLTKQASTMIVDSSEMDTQRSRRGTFSRAEDLEDPREVVKDSTALKETLGTILKPKNNDVYVEAKQDVKSSDADDLALTTGDQILVLDMSDTDGWWEGRKLSDGTTGFFPSNFVKIIPAPSSESTKLAPPR